MKNIPTISYRVVRSFMDRLPERRAEGDVEKGFAEADVITEGTFGYENIPSAIPPSQWERLHNGRTRIR